MKAKLAHGEVFAVPLPDGQYIFGRILLDLYGLLKRRLLPHDTTLSPGHAYLVEMYSETRATREYVPSPVLIAGAYVQSKEIGDTWSEWPIVAHEPVDPRLVEFPEALIGFDHPDGNVAFRCGEIQIPVPMTQRAIPAERRLEYLLSSGESVGCVHQSQRSAYLWPITCLIALGRENEVPRVYKGVELKNLRAQSLEKSDLRLSPFRAQIYEYLPFRIDQSYFEKQKQLGLDIERLYPD